jgi:hypothetical protein
MICRLSGWKNAWSHMVITPKQTATPRNDRRAAGAGEALVFPGVLLRFAF